MQQCSREIKGNGFTVCLSYSTVYCHSGGGTDCVGLTEMWRAASSIFVAYDDSPQEYFGL